MFYKNKQTGLIWNITDENILARISKDPNYEKVEEQKVSQPDNGKDVPKKNVLSKAKG